MSVGAEGLKEIREREAQWKKRGAPVEVLSAEKAHALSGAECFTGALLDRRAGTIQPLAYARGLARAALAAGAEIFTDTPLLGASRQGDLWKLKTGRGTVTAVFFGRKKLAGLTPGRRLVVEGVIAPLGNRYFVYNPLYELLP